MNSRDNKLDDKDNSMSNLYQEIYQHIEQKVSEHNDSYVSDLDGTIPDDICQALQSAVISKTRGHLAPTKMDLLAKEIYESESQWRAQQIDRIQTIVGDIPKYSIGSEIRNGSELVDYGLNLDKLMEDVLQLPNISVVEDESSTENTKILKEYMNLKDELRKKCTAIRIGENKVQESRNSIDRLKVFMEDISRESDSIEYLSKYHEKLILSLVDLRYSLEEAIKTSDENPAKKAKLQQILKRFDASATDQLLQKR